GAEGALAICVRLEEGERILDQIARDLVTKVVDVLRTSAGDPHGLAAEWSKIAFEAARDDSTLYLAALCFGSINQARFDYTLLRDDVRNEALPTPEELLLKSTSFRELLQMVGSNKWHAPSLQNETGVLSRILKRAQQITDLPDANERLREAIWASAELEVIIPHDPSLEIVR